MALTPGTRLGPYEVVAQIGVGGMGEVYRATDTNLKRAVAIKVLPASVAGDAERLARFQREAEVLPDDTIIIATNNATNGLQRVPAAGGPRTVLTRPDRAQGEGDHLWPEMLPGGRAALFTITALTAAWMLPRWLSWICRLERARSLYAAAVTPTSYPEGLTHRRAPMAKTVISSTRQAAHYERSPST